MREENDTGILIDSYRDSMIRDLGRLIAYPSVSGEPDGVYPFGKPCGDALDEFLKIAEENGFSGKNLDYYSGYADFSDGLPETELGILAHLDVVAAGSEGWESDPFRAEVKNGRVYGRGAIDDKGPAIAALYAMKAVRESGTELKRNVRLIVGCSEETGGEKDIGYYAEKEKMPPHVVTPDADFPVITTEKGMARVFFSREITDSAIESIHGGEAVNAVPDKAQAVFKDNRHAALATFSSLLSHSEHVRVSSSDIEVTGKSAHASVPEMGKNAVTGLLNILNAIMKDEDWISSLARLFPVTETGGQSLGIYSKDESGETTCVLSVLSLEDGVLSGKIDMRLPLSITAHEASETVKAKLEEAGFAVEVLVCTESHNVDGESGFVKTLLEVYEKHTGNEGYCKSIGGGTYVHGIEGGVAFGIEFPNENNNMHGANEFVKISSLLTAAKIYAEVIARVCG